MSAADTIAATMKLAKQYEQGLLTPQDYKKALMVLAIVCRTKF